MQYNGTLWPPERRPWGWPSPTCNSFLSDSRRVVSPSLLLSMIDDVFCRVDKSWHVGKSFLWLLIYTWQESSTFRKSTQIVLDHKLAALLVYTSWATHRVIVLKLLKWPLLICCHRTRLFDLKFATLLKQLIRVSGSGQDRRFYYQLTFDIANQSVTIKSWFLDNFRHFALVALNHGVALV